MHDNNIDLNPNIGINTSHGISWAAILAGAAAAIALTFILVILGVGLGLASISPWINEGIEAGTLTLSTIIWLTLSQIIACGIGGYIAGRLRVRWNTVNNDEVYFRDTVHGMLVWAISCILTVLCLSSSISNALTNSAKIGGAIAQGVGQTAAISAAANLNNDDKDNILSYYIEQLFRSDQVSEDNHNLNMQAARIILHDLKDGKLSPENKAYLVKILAKKTNLSQADAERRVNDVFMNIQNAMENAKNKTKQAADKARKAIAAVSIWVFIKFLCGAFAASLAATWGGRQRDAI